MLAYLSVLNVAERNIESALSTPIEYLIKLVLYAAAECLPDAARRHGETCKVESTAPD